MKEQTFIKLVDRYLKGFTSKEEETLVEAYLAELESSPAKLRTGSEEEAIRKMIYSRIQAGMKEKKGRFLFLQSRRARVAAVAAIFLFLVSGYWLLVNSKNSNDQVAINKQSIKDLPPGRDAAILTLSDGKQFILDSASGTLTRQNGIAVINLNGLLSYKQEQADNKQPQWHTVTTARGNQYQLELSDGTRVWLNSSSTLHFPSWFSGDKREVELSGEGYFEVAASPRASLLPSGNSKGGVKRPFLVKSGDQVVEVLGTHFNIQAYPDESGIKTTLLEGSVKVNKGTQSAVLTPGQQAQSVGSGSINVRSGVDITKVMAWKNGIFEFDNTDLPTIMRQISRWYDVDVVFEGRPGTEEYGGSISRNLNLSNILRLLEVTGVEFRLEGRKLIVKPASP